MLTRRNFFMMITMIAVVLVLFLSSVVLKEYFNDYDVNHWVESEIIEKKEQILSEEDPVVYIGEQDNGYYDAMKEWAGYRKKNFQDFLTLEKAKEFLASEKDQKVCLLMDGEQLEKKTEKRTAKLLQYVKRGYVVIFYRMPSYQTIQNSWDLKELLGIQYLRAESVTLHEIWLYSGFLLGGDSRYSFEGVKDPELVDLEREVPWYDISSRTKTYMVGFLTEEEKGSQDLENEDMPALIWRSNLEKGSVFVVNGDYMKGESALGMLDAMIYETEDYVLYPVVNAQNLSVAGFPDLTVENETVMAETYGMTTVQFCQDILWPSLVASIQSGNWKITSFLSVKQKDSSSKEPKKKELIDYLKFFNEESAEAGVTLGRKGGSDIRFSVEDERKRLDSWNLKYVFAGGYVRKENMDQLSALIDGNGKMEYFQDIRTVVEEYDEGGQVLSWLTDQITLQNTTTNAYRHSYKDSLRLKSSETTLGYSNVLVDIYPVLWPESRKEEWQEVAEKMAANIDTYWKPFSAFEKTTISQSDSRVRNFLNGRVESSRDGNQITIQTADYTGEAYLLLRTHGEMPEKMTGGSWKEVEKNAYLLTLSSEEATLTLKPEKESYYQE